MLKQSSQLNIYQRNNPNSVQVFLRLHNGNGCSLNVSKLITLAELRTKIEQSQIETPNQYQLIFQGKKLAKLDQPIANIGVTDGSIIHIDSCSNISANKLKLDVAFFYHGEKIVIRASRNETILELKTKIYRLIGVLPRHQMIIFRGSKLQDTLTLTQYHIAQDSLICLHTNTVQQKTPSKPFKQNRQLILATTSVNLSKEAVKRSNFNMFRSQSMGGQKQAFQVEIQQDNRSELLGSKDFQFQLLTPITMPFISQLQQGLSNQQNLSSSSQMQFKILLNQKQTLKINIKLPIQ